MKNTCLIVTVMLFLLATLNLHMKGFQESLADRINHTLDRSESKFIEGNAGEGAQLILESIMLFQPLSNWPVEFLDEAKAAMNLFQENQFDEAVVSVNKLRKYYPGIMEQENPDDPDHPGAVALKMKNGLDSTRLHMKEGRIDQAVSILLSSLSLLAPMDQ